MVKIKRAEIETLEEAIDRIIDDLYNSNSNGKIRMKEIGQALLNERLNCMKNIQFIKGILQDAGIEIITT